MKVRAVTLVILLALAACSSDTVEPRQLCPQTAIIRELERVNDYGDDRPDDTTKVAAATMQGVTGACQFTDEGVDVNFDLSIAAEKGERLGGNRIEFPFFVSVIAPDGVILGKDQMSTAIEFPNSGDTADKTEHLHVFIPLAKDANGGSYRVLMGFQLTEKQIESVRKQDDERDARLKGQAKPSSSAPADKRTK